MSEHYDFHYQPTGSGAISGQQVLQQTEDAINELGDYVNDNVGGAMDVAQQALETAQNAEQDAQTALDTANSFSGAIQSAQQDASTALSTAQTAQTTASNANNTAIQAQQDASSAVTTANNASGQVSTLSGTVTTLGQRVTTAEGNIGQNTSDITALTTRVGTAEGNITTLQNDVTIAQGNASSAMATAGQVKQQAYVFRYSSTALVASSTNSNTLLDNTDNLKVGDKVIDSSGVLFSITAIDTVNSTFTVGSALVDLATDSDVVHTSGNETVGGEKTFTSSIKGYNSDSTQSTVSIDLRTSKVSRGNTSDGTDTFGFVFRDKNNSALASISCVKRTTGGISEYHTVNTTDSSNNVLSESYSFNLGKDGNSTFRPETNNKTLLGTSTNNWKGVYATNYYYGANNVEFSTKFVTTDTNQTISGNKTFSDTLTIYNSDDTQTPKGLTIRNAQWGMGESGGATVSSINFLDKNSAVPVSIIASKGSSGQSFLRFSVRTKDSQNNTYAEEIYYNIDTSGNVSFRPWHDNIISLGTSAYKWKDVYATNYYYGANNVEFSTKFVTTDTAQTITESKTFANTIKSQKEIEFTGNRSAYILPQFSASYSGLSLCTYGSSGAVRIGTWKVDDNDNTKHVLDSSLGYLNISTGSANSINIVYLTPRNASKAKLGDSANKWHEINGVEPSSLSLPSSNLNDIIDISSYLTYLDGSSANTYIAPANGWISITMGNCSGIQAYITGLWGHQIVRPTVGGVRFLMPILKDKTANILIFGGTIDNARFIPCQGNV